MNYKLGILGFALVLASVAAMYLPISPVEPLDGGGCGGVNATPTPTPTIVPTPRPHSAAPGLAYKSAEALQAALTARAYAPGCTWSNYSWTATYSNGTVFRDAYIRSYSEYRAWCPFYKVGR